MSVQLDLKRKTAPCVHTLVMIVLMLMGQFVPTIGSIQPLGMQVIFIFAGIIYGWSTLGMITPSLLGIFFIGLLEGNTMVTTLATAFGDRIALCLLFFLIFSALIDQVGLSKYIANWCVSRKLVAGRPWGIAVMFCLAAGIISATVNLFAAMILMWGIFYSFCEEVQIKPQDPYAAIVLIGIIYSASLCGGLFPFMGGSLIVIGQQLAFTGADVNFLKFTMMQLVMAIISAVLFFAAAKFIFKPDTSFMKNYKPVSNEALTMSRDQKFVLALLVLTVFILFAPGFLPAAWPLVIWLKALDIAIVPAMMVVFYYVYKSGREDKVSFETLMAKVNWDLIFMFATVAVLSKAFIREDAGLMLFLNESLSGLFNGMSPFIFVATIITIASITTQFANNIAIILVFSPIMYGFALQLGVDPFVITVISAFALNQAFATPAASGPAAMIFSNKKWVPTKMAYTWGLMIFFINLFAAFIGTALAQMLV